MSIQVASGKLNFSVHTVLCDVSIQKKVCNEKIMCPYKSEWMTVEWKGRRIMCPYKGEWCVHTNCEADVVLCVHTCRYKGQGVSILIV